MISARHTAIVRGFDRFPEPRNYALRGQRTRFLLCFSFDHFSEASSESLAFSSSFVLLPPSVLSQRLRLSRQVQGRGKKSLALIQYIGRSQNNGQRFIGNFRTNLFRH